VRADLIPGKDKITLSTYMGRRSDPIPEGGMKGHTQAREAEELRRVAEIVLGRALEGRDSPTSLGTAERAESLPAQAGQTAGKFSLPSGGVSKLTGRAIDIAQDAYRGAVAHMQRLAGRQDADTEADARAIAENAVAEEAERQAPEQKLAAVVAPRQEEAKCQMVEDPRLETGETARKAAEGKPKPDAEAEEQAERAEADLAQARVRTQELERQLSIRQNDQKLLAQERARTRELEQQLMARGDEQKLLAQARARTQELEQQLSIQQNDQKLLAQEQARTQELEQQLMARGDEQKLPAQARTRTQELEQQLSIRHNDLKLLAPEAPGNPEQARLVEQAHLLLDQGNIITARSVLERAAGSGSTLALFLLAETYDPASLSAWGIFSRLGIFGRRGDVTRARELYAKAAARGVHEAKYRLSLLR
jgi:hypothetical protein